MQIKTPYIPTKSNPNLLAKVHLSEDGYSEKGFIRII